MSQMVLAWLMNAINVTAVLLVIPPIGVSALRFNMLHTGAFMGADSKPLVGPGELPNCNMRLYGGAQFHRAMAEFRVGVGQMACPSVTRVSCLRHLLGWLFSPIIHGNHAAIQH